MGGLQREYFWLAMFVLLENVIALGIEVGNGGVWTDQGHYYSWDIRLIALFFAFACLLTYYSKVLFKFHVQESVYDERVYFSEN